MRQAVDEGINGRDGRAAGATRSHEHLGVGRRRENQLGGIEQRRGQGLPGGLVVKVVRIEHGDDDPRVEHDHAHSRRSSSRLPWG